MGKRLTEWARLKIRAAGRKHAEQVHECYLCGKKCRGNGGIASHSRACYAANGMDWFPPSVHRQARPDDAYRVAYRAREDAIRARLQPEKAR